MSDEIKHIFVNPNVSAQKHYLNIVDNCIFIGLYISLLILAGLIVYHLYHKPAKKDVIQTCYEFNVTDGKTYLIPIQCTITETTKEDKQETEYVHV